MLGEVLVQVLIDFTGSLERGKIMQHLHVQLATEKETALMPCIGVRGLFFGKCEPVSTCLSTRLILEDVYVLARVTTRGVG